MTISEAQIFVGQELFRINESLTLDSPEKLDSNQSSIRKLCGASSGRGVFLKKIFTGGLPHGACTRRERVRPIRLDSGIGALDRETCLS
jgi:hypothetical protein